MLAKLDRIFQLTIHGLFLALFFLLPLIFWIPNSEVFELPKMYFVYAMTTLISGLWLARMVVRREIVVKRTPLDIPVLLFLISQIAGTIYSIDPHISWFGWYGRFNGGLLSTISYTLLYYALVNNKIMSNEKKVMSNEEKKNKSTLFSTHYFLLIILSSAAIVSLYALLQHFGVDRDFWVQDVMNRVFSTQGQPNWLAGYIVMAAPLALAMTIMSNEQKVMSNVITFYFLLIIFFVVLLFTKSRSGLLGFAVADVVFWGLILIRIKRFKIPFGVTQGGQDSRFKKTFLLIHGLILVLILITNNPARIALTHQRPLREASINASTIPRESEHGGTESGDIRRIVWNGAIQLVKQRPIFGFGPETFGLTYWQVRPKEHNLTSEWNFLYNKAHNEWLNLAANTGMFGLGAHLLLVIWFSIWVLKGRALLDYAILAALLGVETINFFGFSTVTTETYRYLFMGIAVAIGVESNEQKIMSNEKTQDKMSKRISLLSTFYFLLICFTTLYLLFQISRLYFADLKYNLGRQFYSAGVVGEALKPLSQAVDLAPSEPVFRNELAEALSAAAISIWADGDRNQAIKVKNEAVANFKIVSGQSKYNLIFTRTQAQMEFLMRQIDPDLAGEALILAQRAIYLSPTDPRGYYLLGRMYEELGEKTKAQDFYRKAVELKPDYEEARKMLNTEY